MPSLGRVELAQFENKFLLEQQQRGERGARHHHGWRKSWKRHREIQTKGRLQVCQGWASVPRWKVNYISGLSSGIKLMLVATLSNGKLVTEPYNAVLLLILLDQFVNC